MDDPEFMERTRVNRSRFAQMAADERPPGPDVDGIRRTIRMLGGVRGPALLIFDPREALLEHHAQIAAAMCAQANQRFDEFGPGDERGAAFWDVYTALLEGRLP